MHELRTMVSELRAGIWMKRPDQMRTEDAACSSSTPVAMTN